MSDQYIQGPLASGYYEHTYPPVANNPAEMRRAETGSQAPKQYVFIDESTRDSKRSKITRACISCRRRKIKCVWTGEVCTTCQRLGTECVVQAQEGFTEAAPIVTGHQAGRHAHGEEAEGDMPSGKRIQQERRPSGSTPNSTQDNQSSVSPPSSQTGLRGVNMRRPHQGNRRTSQKVSQGPIATASKTPLTDSMPGVNTLTDIFGQLHIEQDGFAGYINDNVANAEDDDFYRKRMATDMFSGSSEWPVSHEDIVNSLPDDDLGFALLKIYFEDLHPYLPVINRQTFYQDYINNREAVSPFLLLSIFALAARFSDDPRVLLFPDDAASRGDTWWHLVQRYSDEFRDAPRLSTVQADVLNLKNLESRPKTKGYWYRAYYNLSCAIRMCRDLSLHQRNKPIVFDAEANAGRCAWQVCFIYDQMMSSSQGREMQLDMSLIDLTLLPPVHAQTDSNSTEEEINLHNDFVFMVGLFKILRRGTVVFRTVGIKFPFAAEPSYPALSDVLLQWHANLPKRLQYCPFKDQRLPNHFVGQLHLTYCLITCLHHRPWIVSVGAYGASGEWRTHLRKCNESARSITATYEVLFRQYGSHSVQYMLRGTYYAMYVCVVATMIHAVSLTCPEQEFSEGASDFFSRSLSILDQLAVISSTPMMRKQIEVLRGIFASNTKQQSARFDPQTLPPELASLQEQYRKIQQQQSQQALRTVQKQLSDRLPVTSELVSAEMMQSTYGYPLVPGGYGEDGMAQYGDPSQVPPYFPGQDMFAKAPISYGSQLDTVTLGSSPASIRPDVSPSPSMLQQQQLQYTAQHLTPEMHWDPAGLIDAWNSNFPSASGPPVPNPLHNAMTLNVSTPLDTQHQSPQGIMQNVYATGPSSAQEPMYFVPAETMSPNGAQNY